MCPTQLPRPLLPNSLRYSNTYSIQATAAIKAIPPYIVATRDAPPVNVGAGGLVVYTTVPLADLVGLAEIVEEGGHEVTLTTVVEVTLVVGEPPQQPDGSTMAVRDALVLEENAPGGSTMAVGEGVGAGQIDPPSAAT